MKLTVQTAMFDIGRLRVDTTSNVQAITALQFQIDNSDM